jgi:hypothetical protein
LKFYLEKPTNRYLKNPRPKKKFCNFSKIKWYNHRIGRHKLFLSIIDLQLIFQTKKNFKGFSGSSARGCPKACCSIGLKELINSSPTARMSFQTFMNKTTNTLIVNTTGQTSILKERKCAP